MEFENEAIRLTQFSHGAGCGCKISPQALDRILKGVPIQAAWPNLLVGNESRDDAAVLDIGGGQAIISTTDFFMPIVDDAYDFGRIAAANSISDVYAMGGKPLMAIAILGWPVEKLPLELASKVLEGGRAICEAASMPLAGGHSIDSPEPIFGLAVTGIVDKQNLKQNGTAKAGDWLFLTKSIGVGVLSTAMKRGVLAPEHQAVMVQSMSTLNKIGEQLGKIEGVTAMTDVTGFGLLGHLAEMAVGSGLSAAVFYEKLPVLAGAREYVSKRIFPDATTRNWSSYGERVKFGTGVNVLEAFTLLPDPQTNGGLLFSVEEAALEEVKALLRDAGMAEYAEPIGQMIAPDEKLIQVL